jgi:thioredoxin
VRARAWEAAIHHKDLLPVVYVTGRRGRRLDSPLYGMFDLVGQVNDNLVGGQALAQRFFAQPEDTAGFAIKWDGEWQITYETFRDMGIAYAAGMVLIYLLVVAQFRSYVVPLVIMAPIPLTVIGVMPGHALLGAQFTATSMIGMIALAGIIVRNSILLVDFINQRSPRPQRWRSRGRGLRGARAADRADRAGGDGRRVLHPRRSDLQRPCDLADLRHPGLHRADAGGDPAAVLLLVDFWAPWCGPCRLMAPAFAQAAQQLEPQFHLAKVDTEAQPALGQQFGIRSIPTLVLFHHGNEVARQSGALNAAGIVQFARSAFMQYAQGQ